MPSGSAGAFVSAPLTLGDAALFTDLYELTMAAAFFREGLNGSATFSLFVRRLPPERGFLVAAGLADVLEYLRGFRFSADALDYLRSLDRFEPAFLSYLKALRFTGQVRAVREGTVLFADEPMLEVTAPLIEAQVIETAVINFCHLQTLLASKAARAVLAAGGRSLAEFGLRRSHGTDAGMKAARCAILAGFDSTSNVLAGRTFAAPLSGTMAHSFVTAFPREIDAFLAYARSFPDSAVLLLDTYDTPTAARLAVVGNKSAPGERDGGNLRKAGVRFGERPRGAVHDPDPGDRLAPRGMDLRSDGLLQSGLADLPRQLRRRDAAPAQARRRAAQAPGAIGGRGEGGPQMKARLAPRP